MQAHFLQALRHTPVFIDSHHFRTHQTTGSVFIIFQQVNEMCIRDRVYTEYFLTLIKVDNSVDVDLLARQTPGFSGADLSLIHILPVV